MRLPIFILVVLAAVIVSQVVHFYPYLPDLVVSHWGPGGRPDGWLSKSNFFLAMVVSELGITGILIALTLGLPRIISKRWWNLPQKDYWLAPERRSDTVRFVRAQMLWLTVIIEAGMVILWQSTINANVKPELHWPANFWWGLLVTTLIVLVWIVRFTRHFNSRT